EKPARAGVGVPVPRGTVDDRAPRGAEGLLGPGDASRGGHQAGHERCSSLVRVQSSESVSILGGRGSVRAAYAQATGSPGGSPSWGITRLEQALRRRLPLATCQTGLADGSGWEAGAGGWSLSRSFHSTSARRSSMAA